MSVGSGLIKSERHPEAGALLQRDARMLIDRWAHRAILEQPSAARVHHNALLDHLRALLHALGTSLAESDPPATSLHWMPAAVHGEQRWDAGWSLPEVVRDYQILRLVIFDYLDEMPSISLSPRLVLAIGLALDEAIAASVTTYVTTRDEHIRRLEAERFEQDRQVQEHLKQREEILLDVDRRKNEFMAVLGHEMRNPLAPLAHAARLLELRAASDSSAAQVCDIVKRQVQQLARLADDLLDISRIAQGKIELRREPITIAQVVEQAAQTSAPHLNARRQELELSLPSAQIRLEADPVRVTQALVNLLNNAAKYTQPGGRIRLMVTADADMVMIRIQDNGLGIPSEMLPHVFELFTQGNWSPDRNEGGMGIGLALVRRLIELHGGTITASSLGLGQGSEFVVRLPRAQSGPGASVETHSAEGGRSTVMGGPGPSRKILVVDDNVDSAKILSMLLSRAGHDVRTVHDGPATLAAADEFGPEIILLDIGLPVMDGYEVVRRLRANPERRDWYVVALTGYGQDDDRRRSHEAGFDAHLVKPVDLDVLQRLIAGLPSKRCGNENG